MDGLSTILTIVGSSFAVIIGLLVFVYNTAKHGNDARREWVRLRRLMLSDGLSDSEKSLLEIASEHENLDFHSWYGSWFHINSFFLVFLNLGLIAVLVFTAANKIDLGVSLTAVVPLCVGFTTLVQSHRFMWWAYNDELSRVFCDGRRHRFWFPAFWLPPVEVEDD